MSKLDCGSLAFRSGLPWAGARWFVGRALGVAAALVVLGFVACSSPTGETAVGGSEASTLGTATIAMEEFEASSSGGSCAVTWRGTPALTVEQCKGGLVPQAVPIVVAGITYAVWATESCSAGGACAGMQFYAITTDATRAWASPAFGQGYRLTRIMPRADGITLELEPATDGGATIYFELRMGDVRKGVASSVVAPRIAAEPPPSDEEPKIVRLQQGWALTWQGKMLMKYASDGDPASSPLTKVLSVSTAATNFYFYGIPPIGDAYDTPGNTYYLVGVTATDAWCPESIGRYNELNEVKTTDEGIMFTLDGPDTTKTCSVTGREVLCAKPVVKKRVEPKILSTRRITVTGQLGMGPRLANHMPVIWQNSGADYIVIDDAGPCSVEDNYDRKVQSTLRCDERTDMTFCHCEQLRVLD